MELEEDLRFVISRHLRYDEDETRGNRQWEGRELGGEVEGGTGGGLWRRKSKEDSSRFLKSLFHFQGHENEGFMTS